MPMDPELAVQLLHSLRPAAASAGGPEAARNLASIASLVHHQAREISELKRSLRFASARSEELEAMAASLATPEPCPAPLCACGGTMEVESKEAHDPGPAAWWCCPDCGETSDDPICVCKDGMDQLRQERDDLRRQLGEAQEAERQLQIMEEALVDVITRRGGDLYEGEDNPSLVLPGQAAELIDEAQARVRELESRQSTQHCPLCEAAQAKIAELESRFDRLVDLLDSVTFDNADVAQQVMLCFPGAKCQRMRGDGAPDEGGIILPQNPDMLAGTMSTNPDDCPVAPDEVEEGGQS